MSRLAFTRDQWNDLMDTLVHHVKGLTLDSTTLVEFFSALPITDGEYKKSLDLGGYWEQSCDFVSRQKDDQDRYKAQHVLKSPSGHIRIETTVTLQVIFDDPTETFTVSQVWATCQAEVEGPRWLTFKVAKDLPIIDLNLPTDLPQARTRFLTHLKKDLLPHVQRFVDVDVPALAKQHLPLPPSTKLVDAYVLF